MIFFCAERFADRIFVDLLGNDLTFLLLAGLEAVCTIADRVPGSDGVNSVAEGLRPDSLL